jgi:S1-C subfamily serine protease
MASGGSAPNVLDAVLVLLLVYAVVRGWRQGAVSQLGVFGGVALGLLVGAWATPRIIGWFTDEPGPGVAVLTLVLLLAVVLAGQGIGFAVGRRLHAVATHAGAGKLDRAAGVGVGVAGLVCVVWLLSGVLAQGPVPALAQQVRGSQAVQALDEVLPPPPDVVGGLSAYLDGHGFPQVFAGLGGGIAVPEVPATADAAVRAAAAAGQPSTVQVRALGCGATIGSGSGFVAEPGFVVTNAHVVAGFDRLTVRDAAGEHDAVPVLVDPDLDIAVLAAPDVDAPAIGWAADPAVRGVAGATLGFPGGQSEMVVRPATVRARLEAIGRDIYGDDRVRREILALSADVERGDSGGPFVTSDGLVAGVVFGGDPAGGTGYALTAEQVRPVVEDAIARNQEVGVGACRF